MYFPYRNVPSIWMISLQCLNPSIVTPNARNKYFKSYIALKVSQGSYFPNNFCTKISCLKNIHPLGEKVVRCIIITKHCHNCFSLCFPNSSIMNFISIFIFYYLMQCWYWRKWIIPYNILYLLKNQGRPHLRVGLWEFRIYTSMKTFVLCNLKQMVSFMLTCTKFPLTNFIPPLASY